MNLAHLKKILTHPLAVFLCGAAAYALISYATSSFDSGTLDVRNSYETGEQYHFIDPLLTCADTPSDHLDSGKSRELKDRVQDLIDSLKAVGKITEAGVYFRELHDGPRFGINEDVLFTPSSLLKVPLAMSVYKVAESDPTFLSKAVTYTGDQPAPPEYFKAPVIEKGHTYTVEQLVEAALQNSDNSAAFVLGNLIGMDRLNDSYSHLAIAAPTAGRDYTTTVSQYASFFRVLFTATYLTHSASEHILSILSDTKFSQGLVAGVPKSVVVSHKFGERTIEGSSVVQLHDCGIVYAQNNPYLICVMLRGTDLNVLASSVQAISSLIYTYVE